MKKLIEDLENNLNELKNYYAKEQQMTYENSEHINFADGDLVTNGKDVGTVGWTENKHMNITRKMGYMGVSLISGNRGFVSPVKRDEWRLVDDPYYTTTYKIRLSLTGTQIEELKYIIGPSNCNPNKTKDVVLAYLNNISEG